MARVSIFVDGFNVYHALQNNPEYRKYKWLDYRALGQRYLDGQDTLAEVFFFTALAMWNPGKVNRHKIYLSALRKNHVTIVMGKFRRRDRKCFLCKKTYKTHEEKLTDVNIAIHLFRGAYLDEYDKAILITGDSDIIPSVNAIHELFPSKEIGLVIPIGGKAEELKQSCDFRRKMKVAHLRDCQFPDRIEDGPDGAICRPVEWQ